MNASFPAAAFRRAEWTVAAVAFGAAALLVAQPAPAALPAALLLLGVLLGVAAIDLRERIIPDGLVAAVAVLGAGWRIAGAGSAGTFPEAGLLVLDGLAWGGAFLLVREIHFRRRGFDGLGLGDVKLAAACGMLNGTAGFAWVLLAASLAGMLAAFTAALAGRKIETIPFGAFLAPASAALWLAGWPG